jgi:hypothetical protein
MRKLKIRRQAVVVNYLMDTERRLKRYVQRRVLVIIVLILIIGNNIGTYHAPIFLNVQGLEGAIT